MDEVGAETFFTPADKVKAVLINQRVFMATSFVSISLANFTRIFLAILVIFVNFILYFIDCALVTFCFSTNLCEANVLFYA